jgi:hypothetical protein
MILNDNVNRKWCGIWEVVVAKFEALFRYWCEGTEEYQYKLWSRGRNFNLQQVASKTLTHSLTGAAGN